MAITNSGGKSVSGSIAEVSHAEAPNKQAPTVINDKPTLTGNATAAPADNTHGTGAGCGHRKHKRDSEKSPQEQVTCVAAEGASSSESNHRKQLVPYQSPQNENQGQDGRSHCSRSHRSCRRSRHQQQLMPSGSGQSYECIKEVQRSLLMPQPIAQYQFTKTQPRALPVTETDTNPAPAIEAVPAAEPPPTDLSPMMQSLSRPDRAPPANNSTMPLAVASFLGPIGLGSTQPSPAEQAAVEARRDAHRSRLAQNGRSLVMALTQQREELARQGRQRIETVQDRLDEATHTTDMVIQTAHSGTLQTIADVRTQAEVSDRERQIRHEQAEQRRAVKDQLDRQQRILQDAATEEKKHAEDDRRTRAYEAQTDAERKDRREKHSLDKDFMDSWYERVGQAKLESKLDSYEPERTEWDNGIDHHGKGDKTHWLEGTDREKKSHGHGHDPAHHGSSHGSSHKHGHGHASGHGGSSKKSSKKK